MVLKLAVCLMIFIQVSSAQHYHCCTQQQWEAFYSVVTGFVDGTNPPNAVVEGRRVHYDLHGMRTAASGATYDENSGHGFRWKLIDNFTTKKRLYVEGGVCHIATIDYPMRQPCIPDNFTHSGPEYIGVSPGNISVDVWRAPIAYPDEFHVRTLSHECIPFQVRRVIFDHDHPGGFAAASFVSYNGVTYGIKDDTVFDTPTECQPLTNEDIIPKDARDALSMFHVYQGE